MKSLSGEVISFDRYRGKVVIVVNTASKCGFTPQYEGLQQLYNKYKDKGLEILGFPSNQFFQQEPGTDDEIKEFCQLNYGVTFDMFSKIDVNGEDTSPLYVFLKDQVKVGYHDPKNETAVKMQSFLSEKVPQNLEGKNIRWNFTKFLIDRQGNVIKRFETYVPPEDLIVEISKLL
jgi:glutathione peroxidase